MRTCQRGSEFETRDAELETKASGAADFRVSIFEFPIRRASMATTIAWQPYCSASSSTKSGASTAAVFTATLSAPAASRRRASASARTPPPTVSGMNSLSATRWTVSISVARPSLEAEISSITSSSTPSRLYASASWPGSPASRRLTNSTPFTTRPSLQSRHGMILLANIRKAGSGD